MRKIFKSTFSLGALLILTSCTGKLAIEDSLPSNHISEAVQLSDDDKYVIRSIFSDAKVSEEMEYMYNFLKENGDFAVIEYEFAVEDNSINVENDSFDIVDGLSIRLMVMCADKTILSRKSLFPRDDTEWMPSVKNSVKKSSTEIVVESQDQLEAFDKFRDEVGGLISKMESASGDYVSGKTISFDIDGTGARSYYIFQAWSLNSLESTVFSVNSHIVIGDFPALASRIRKGFSVSWDAINNRD